MIQILRQSSKQVLDDALKNERDIDLKQCHAYLHKQRNFETIQSSFYRILIELVCFNSEISGRNKNHLMMVDKVLLNHSWKLICERYDFSGRKEAENQFRSELASVLS